MSVRESMLAAVALLVPACVSSPHPPPGAAAGTEAEALAAIRELHQQDQAASLSGDAQALMALWSADPIALPPAGPILQGRDRMEKNLRQMLSDSSWEMIEYVQEFLEIVVVGDYAWDLGTFRGRVRNRAAGTEMASAGKLLRILMRSENGAWKVHRSMWVEDPPAEAGDVDPGAKPVPAATGSVEMHGQASAIGQADDFLVTEPEWSRDGERLVFAGGVWPDLDVFALAAT
ncbi:MAG: nuclear transport factor 2 family protein, partial [Gemmatimonadota bacterium]